MRRGLLILLLSFLVYTVVWAAGLNTLSDVMVRHTPGQPTDHQSKFRTTAGLGEAGQTLSLEFDSGFDLSAINFSDISLSHGPSTGLESSETIAISAGLTSWGASISGQIITFEHPTDGASGDIAPGDFIVILIGTNAGGTNQIINPVTEGSKIIRISTSLGETGALAVPIFEDQVGVSGGVAGNVTATIQWAMPQQRVGAPESNDDATFYLTARTPDDNDDTILFTQSTLLTTDVDGTYLTPIPFSTVAAGTYDVGIKTNQHITKILNDVALADGNNVLNFTQLDNSAPKGTEVLVAGDINGMGLDPASLGDDVVNATDLSVMISVFDDDDFSGNGLRANLNQDPVVNAIDLSMLINNLDAEGDN